jgi:hypothetical protein
MTDDQNNTDDIDTSVSDTSVSTESKKPSTIEILQDLKATIDSKFSNQSSTTEASTNTENDTSIDDTSINDTNKDLQNEKYIQSIVQQELQRIDDAYEKEVNALTDEDRTIIKNVNKRLETGDWNADEKAILKKFANDRTNLKVVAKLMHAPEKNLNTKTLDIKAQENKQEKAIAFLSKNEQDFMRNPALIDQYYDMFK